jgi:hypothetical protein
MATALSSTGRPAHFVSSTGATSPTLRRGDYRLGARHCVEVRRIRFGPVSVELVRAQVGTIEGMERRLCIHCGKDIGTGTLELPTPENIARWSAQRGNFFVRYKVDQQALCFKCIHALDPERFGREGIQVDPDEPHEIPSRPSRYF